MMLKLTNFNNLQVEELDSKTLDTIANGNGTYVRDFQRLSSNVGYIAVKETIEEIEQQIKNGDISGIPT